MKLYHPVLMVFLAIFLASCVNISVSQRPKQWKPVPGTPENICANLAGTYLNKAIEAPDNQDRVRNENLGKSIFLSEILVQYIPWKYFARHTWTDTVSLEYIDKEQLEVIFEKNGKNIFRKMFKKNEDFECSSGGLIFSETSNRSNEFGLDIRFEKKIITKSLDGSLIVTFQKEDVGVAILIPGYSRIVQRYKFPLVR